jgi:hypothetical protein
MMKPVKVEALPSFRLRIAYPDGVDGIIDLSGNVGKGVFAPLVDPAFFATVYIGQYGQIAWSDEIEICSDAAHQEIMAQRKTEAAHA